MHCQLRIAMGGVIESLRATPASDNSDAVPLKCRDHLNECLLEVCFPEFFAG